MESLQTLRKRLLENGGHGEELAELRSIIPRIDHFWTKVLVHSGTIAMQISHGDVEVLQYLNDIIVVDDDVGEDQVSGFTITFVRTTPKNSQIDSAPPHWQTASSDV